MPPTVPDTSRSVAVKVANGHDLHRIALPEPSFDALQIKVAEAFRRPKDAVHLVYADSDNDKITVCDDEGLREALNELKVGNTLRLELLDKRPAAALAATEATNAAAPAATTTMTTTTVAATATTSAATEAVAAALRPTSRSTAPHPAASTLRPLSMATTTVEGAVGPGINLQPVALAKNLAAPAAAAAQQFAGVKPQPTLTAIKPEARSDLQMRPLYVARKPEGSAATSTEGTAAAPPASTYNLVSSPIYVSEPIGEKPKSHAKPPTTDSSKLLRGMLRPPSKEVVLAAAQAAAKAAEDSTRESAVKSTAKPTAAKPTAKSTATPTATLAANPATKLMARPTTQTTAKPAAAAAQRPVAARTAAPRAAAAAAAAAHTPSSTTPRTAPRPSKGLQKPPSASGKSGAAQRAAIATNAATAAAAGGAPSEASGLGSNFGVTYKGGYLLAQDMVGQIAAEAVDPYTDFFLPLADANYFMSTEQYPDFIIVGAGAVGLNTAMGIAYNSNETNKKIWVLESGNFLSGIYYKRDRGFTDNVEDIMWQMAEDIEYTFSVDTTNEPPLDSDLSVANVMAEISRTVGGAGTSINEPVVKPIPFLNDGGMSYSPLWTAGDHSTDLKQRRLDAVTPFDNGSDAGAYYTGLDAKMQRMRQISDAYDSKLTTATMTNASAVQQHSGLVTSSSVPRAYIGLPGQVETPEAAFLSSQLATDAPRLAGYNAFEQLLAYRRYYPGCTNTIQLVTQCHVDLLYFDPNTISSAPTDFATVSGMKIKTDAGATTYEWDFTYNVKADKIIPVIMANGVPGGPQLLARSIAAASFQDSEDPDDPKWVVNMARHHAGKNINGDMMVSFAVASVLYDYETGKEIFPVVSDDESDAHILDDHPLVTVINLSPEIIRSGHTTADSTTTQSSWWQYTDNDVQVASEMVVLIKPREFVGETHQTPVWNLPENRINDLVHEIYEQIPDCLRNMYCSVLTADNEEIGYYDYGQLHRMLTQLLVPTATIAIYVGRVAGQPHNHEVTDTGELILRPTIRDQNALTELILKAPTTMGRIFGRFSEHATPAHWMAWDAWQRGYVEWEPTSGHYQLKDFPQGPTDVDGIPAVVSRALHNLCGGCSLGMVTDSFGNVIGCKNLAALGAMQFRQATAGNSLYQTIAMARHYGASEAYKRMLNDHLGEIRWLQPLCNPNKVTVTITGLSASGTPIPSQNSGTDLIIRVDIARAGSPYYPATGVRVRLSVDRHVLVLRPRTDYTGNLNYDYEKGFSWYGETETTHDFRFLNIMPGFAGQLYVYAEAYSDSPSIDQVTRKATYHFEFV